MGHRTLKLTPFSFSYYVKLTPFAQQVQVSNQHSQTRFSYNYTLKKEAMAYNIKVGKEK